MKKLGFGLMRLPVKDGKAENIDLDAVKQMVDLFLERGFTYFDTSYVYHNGASETAIRDALVKRHERCSFLLASFFISVSAAGTAARSGAAAHRRETAAPRPSERLRQ